MSNVERLTITLTTEMAHAVRGVVESGSYASSSEVIREALRDWQLKRQIQDRQLEELKTDVRAGLDDIDAGRVQDFDAERIIDRGKARLASRSRSA
ncbi:MAG: type II toxin-antitoxin system ParD family antitoxin [Pseudomonadota bacterium]